MAHNSQVRNGSYPMFGLIHVETGFCHPDFSGKQPQSMFETRKLTSDPSLHDQRQITHEPPSKLILYGAKMQAIILLAPHRSTVFCSNQNEIIQKCSGIVSSCFINQQSVPFFCSLVFIVKIVYLFFCLQEAWLQKEANG